MRLSVLILAKCGIPGEHEYNLELESAVEVWQSGRQCGKTARRSERYIFEICCICPPDVSKQLSSISGCACWIIRAIQLYVGKLCCKIGDLDAHVKGPSPTDAWETRDVQLLTSKRRECARRIRHDAT